MTLGTDVSVLTLKKYFPLCSHLNTIWTSWHASRNPVQALFNKWL